MLRPRVRRGEGRVFRLRVELLGVVPPVWRLLEISGRASLDELNAAIEAMFVPATEAYSFEVDGLTFIDANGDPPPGRSTDEVSLDALALHVGSRLTHAADGPSEPWRYAITVEEITPRLVGQRLPACIAGARAAPPDFVESTTEFARLLEVVHTGSTRDDQWNDEFDPDFVDLVTTNAALARVPRHRPDA